MTPNFWTVVSVLRLIWPRTHPHFATLNEIWKKRGTTACWWSPRPPRAAEGGSDFRTERSIKRNGVDKESPASRLFGYSGRLCPPYRLLISRLRRREVLMSYFIAPLRGSNPSPPLPPSPACNLSPFFNISKALRLLLAQSNTPPRAHAVNTFHLCNYRSWSKAPDDEVIDL